MKNKTILVVAYHYPPEEGSCSEKNTRIVKLLKDSGYTVKVLTKAYINEKNSVDVIRTEKNGILHKLKNGNVGCEQNNENKNFKKYSNLKKFISSSIIPDSIIDWFFEVKKLYVKENQLFSNIDLILSISSPYSAHIISNYLSKKMNVPYIMCYGDPWVYEPKRKRNKFRLFIEKNIESKLIKNAKKVLLITEWNKKKYIELYNILENKILTYHIGYDKKDCLDFKVSNAEDKFKIIYGGSLDSVHRDPEPFIKAMRSINGVEVYIYNSDNHNVKTMIDTNGVSDRVHLLPIISSAEFNKKLYEMDALLLFGNKTPFQVPGKVFTYISTNKSIIYIKNNNFDDDGTQMVLNDYGNSVTIKNEENEIIDGLNAIRNKQNQNKINSELFEFHNTMSPILQAVEDVIKEDI